MSEIQNDVIVQDGVIKTMDATGKFVDTTKQLLQWLYNNKSERLTLRPNHKGKNKLLWRQFQIAYLDNVEQPYAMCCECLIFVKYCGRTGTGGLVRHHCFRRAFSIERKQPSHKPDQSDYPKPASLSPGRLEVEDLVMHSSPRIGYIPNYKGKSDVWAQFDIITLDNETLNFAACKICRSIVTYVSRTGTGSMTRHKCQRAKMLMITNEESEPENLTVKQEPREDSGDRASPANTNVSGFQLKAFSDLLQANLQSFRSKVKQPTPSPPPREMPEDLIRRQYLELLRRSLGAFNTMRNDFFFELAQTLVNIGAEYGKIDIRQVLSDAGDIDSILDTD